VILNFSVSSVPRKLFPFLCRLHTPFIPMKSILRIVYILRINVTNAWLKHYGVRGTAVPADHLMRSLYRTVGHVLSSG
jgi:hypothetical protein